MKRVPIRIAVLALAVLALAVAAPLAADPRWWWHDVALTSTPADKGSPDVEIVTPMGAASGPDIYLVTWQEKNGAGNFDIEVMGSFDGGCTWCAPAAAWAGSPAGETRPRIAAGVTPAGKLSLQVVYEREGQVWVAGDASLDLSDPDLCGSFSALAPPVAKLLSRALAGATDSRPRIDAATTGSGALHFHAVWQRAPSAGAPGIEYAKDLSGSGAAWSIGRDLSSGIGEAGASPDVAADALAGALTDSAAVLVFQTASGTVKLVRSVDSGATWGAPALVVSGASGQTLPAVDASAGSAGVWSGVAWQASSSPRDITLDAGFWTSPAARMPDFDPAPGDVPASDPGTGTAPALSVAPDASGSSGSTNPLYAFWRNEDAAPEVVARGGVLSPLGSTPRDLDTPPFAPTRLAPPDPSAADVEPFSNCAWSDGWPAMTAGLCAIAARPPSSSAREVASADTVGSDGLPAQFAAVFSDDRDGTPQIYFKATDGQVDIPVFWDFELVCDSAHKGAAHFRFAPPARCPAAREFIDRYVVYYGKAGPAGEDGPWTDRYVLPETGLGTPTTVYIPGLATPIVRYHFAMVAEDEARNLNPPDFDPRKSGNVIVTDQKRAHFLTPNCVPDVEISMCTTLEDSCNGAPGDGKYNPGDRVKMRVILVNIGDVIAKSVTATLVVTGATILSPPGGVISVPTLAAGTGVTIPVEILLDAACPLSPSMQVKDLASDGSEKYGSPMCASPLLTVDCSTTCPDGGCVSRISTLGSLRGVRKGAAAEFSWSRDAFAARYDLNTVPTKRQIATLGPRQAPCGDGLNQCFAVAPATTCTDPDAIADPARILFYQALAACSAACADEGPW